MEDYKKTLKRRLSWQIALIVVACLIIGISNFYFSTGRNTNNLASFYLGFQTGLAITLLIVMITTIVRTVTALRDEAKIKALYIKEHDERTQLIRYKVAQTTLNVFLFTLAVASIISGFIDQAVFIVLSAVLLCALLIFVAAKAYFRKVS